MPSTWAIAEARRIVEANRRELVTPIQRRLDDHHGERAQLPWRSLLIAFLILGMQNSGGMHTRMAWQVLRSLSPKLQRQLNVVDEHGHVVTYAQVTHLFDRVVKLITEVNDHEHPDEPAFAAWFCEAILQASVDGHLLASNISVDSTDLRSWGRTVFDETRTGKTRMKGEPPVGSTPTEPDAGRGHMSPHDDLPGMVFSGYDAHLFVNTRDDTSGRVPVLIESMSITPAGVNRGFAVLPPLERLLRRRFIDTVYADRGYSMMTWDNWASRINALGLSQCIQLSEKQHADQETLLDAYRIDGWLFSPSLPDGLRFLPQFTNWMTDEEKFALAARYDERAKYAFRVHSRPEDGTIRLQPPCWAGAVRCDKNKPAARTATRRAIPVMGPDNSDELVSCSQQTVSLPLSAFKGVEQKYLYGTSEWVAKYYRRVAVETANSLLKTHHSKMVRGFIRYRRGSAVAVLVGILCAAMNIRTRRVWNAEHSIPEQYPNEMTAPTPRGQAKPRIRNIRKGRKRKFGRTVPQPT